MSILKYAIVFVVAMIIGVIFYFMRKKNDRKQA